MRFTFPPSLSSSSSTSISLTDAALVTALSFSLVKGGVGIDWTFFFCNVAAGDEEEAEKEERAPLVVLFEAEEAAFLDETALKASPVVPLEAKSCNVDGVSSIAPSEDKSIVCFEAEEAEEARLALLEAGPALTASLVLSLVLLDPAWLVDGVIGVLGVAVLLFADADEARGVFAGAAFLKKPSRLDCFAAGLLIAGQRAFSCQSSLSCYCRWLSQSRATRCCFCCLFVVCTLLYAKTTDCRLADTRASLAGQRRQARQRCTCT